MEYHLGGHLLYAAHRLKLGIEEEFVDQSITGFQGRIIDFVFVQNNSKKAVYQKDIESQFNIKRSSVTSVLNTLERNGYVKRKSVESDARLKLVTLTEKGKKSAKQNLSTIIEFEKRMVDNFTGEEIETFRYMLDKVLDNLKEERKKVG